MISMQQWQPAQNCPSNKTPLLRLPFILQRSVFRVSPPPPKKHTHTQRGRPFCAKPHPATAVFFLCVKKQNTGKQNTDGLGR
jgi:hypothetical protein